MRLTGENVQASVNKKHAKREREGREKSRSRQVPVKTAVTCRFSRVLLSMEACLRSRIVIVNDDTHTHTKCTV